MGVTDDGEGILRNESEATLTYMPWYEHTKEAVVLKWKAFVTYSVVLFGISWGIIEAANHFFPGHGLDNFVVLLLALFFSTIGALSRCIYEYWNIVPTGLEGENKHIQQIGHWKKAYWEFHLAHELLRQRIAKIDQNLDDIGNNRVHVSIKQIMEPTKYIAWLQTRPENVLSILQTANRLLIVDLMRAINSRDGDDLDLIEVVRVVDLCKNVYQKLFDYEVEGREIKCPDGFELLHEIQSEWTKEIRSGFSQMMIVLKSVADRKGKDFSSVTASINFDEAPRMDEYCQEIARLEQLLPNFLADEI